MSHTVSLLYCYSQIVYTQMLKQFIEKCLKYSLNTKSSAIFFIRPPLCHVVNTFRSSQYLCSKT